VAQANERNIRGARRADLAELPQRRFDVAGADLVQAEVAKRGIPAFVVGFFGDDGGGLFAGGG